MVNQQYEYFEDFNHLFLFMKCNIFKKILIGCLTHKGMSDEIWERREDIKENERISEKNIVGIWLMITASSFLSHFKCNSLSLKKFR